MRAPCTQFTGSQVFALACFAICFVTAISVLAGWMLDMPLLRTAIPNHPEMKPVTAVSFALISFGLGIAEYKAETVWSKNLAIFIGATSVAVSVLTLLAFEFRFSTGIDSFLLPDLRSETSGGAGMAPHSAICFLLLGISCLFSRSNGSLKRTGGYAALAAMGAASVVLLGHLYRADIFYGVSRFNGMAVHTGALFILISVALVWSNHELKIVQLLRGDSLGGAMARRLIPFVILTPTVIGGLRVLGQDVGLYDTGSGTTMAAFTMALAMIAVISRVSHAVHNSDRKRRRAEEELAEKEQRYRELFNYSQGMICIHDVNGVLETVNPAVVASTGYTLEELRGRNIADFLPEKERSRVIGFFRQIEHEGLSSGLLPIVAKDGRQLMWRYQSIMVTDAGKDPYVIGHAVDVTELVAAQSELRNLSLTDELTGLLNRRGFLTLAEQQLRLERHNRTARGLNLLFADMDGLKKINDTIGHEAGSEAIQTLAQVVKSVVRSGDLVARWGGDEFVLLTIGAQDENIDQMIERIEHRLEEHNSSSGKRYAIACSIGKAPVNLEGDRTFEEIIAEADEAMYAAKRRRKATLVDPPPMSDLPLMHDELAWY